MDNWTKERRKEYREKNRDKARTYQKKYRDSNREKLNTASKKWREDNPEKVKEQTKRRKPRVYIPHPTIRRKYLTSPEQTTKRKSRVTAQTALKKGLLKKQNCSKCGSTETQMHHEDYKKPLDVVWVCRKHHLEIHSRQI